MRTRAEQQHELFEKYQELDDCKLFALKRVLRKFYSVPLEMCDFEFIAWKAFLETEEKFNEKIHQKTYKNFYRDCLYWRAKDYCKKYITNKHRTVNVADEINWSTDYRTYIADDKEAKILDRLALKNYLKVNEDSEKGRVAKLLYLEYSKDHICEDVQISKTKLARVIEVIRDDLNSIFEMHSCD